MNRIIGPPDEIKRPENPIGPQKLVQKSSAIFNKFAFENQVFSFISPQRSPLLILKKIIQMITEGKFSHVYQLPEAIMYDSPKFENDTILNTYDSLKELMNQLNHLSAKASYNLVGKKYDDLLRLINGLFLLQSFHPFCEMMNVEVKYSHSICSIGRCNLYLMAFSFTKPGQEPYSLLVREHPKEIILRGIQQLLKLNCSDQSISMLLKKLGFDINDLVANKKIYIERLSEMHAFYRHGWSFLPPKSTKLIENPSQKDPLPATKETSLVPLIVTPPIKALATKKVTKVKYFGLELSPQRLRQKLHRFPFLSFQKPVSVITTEKSTSIGIFQRAPESFLDPVTKPFISLFAFQFLDNWTPTYENQILLFHMKKFHNLTLQNGDGRDLDISVCFLLTLFMKPNGAQNLEDLRKRMFLLFKKTFDLLPHKLFFVYNQFLPIVSSDMVKKINKWVLHLYCDFSKKCQSRKEYEELIIKSSRLKPLFPKIPALPQVVEKDNIYILESEAIVIKSDGQIDKKLTRRNVTSLLGYYLRDISNEFQAEKIFKSLLDLSEISSTEAELTLLSGFLDQGIGTGLFRIFLNPLLFSSETLFNFLNKLTDNINRTKPFFFKFGLVNNLGSSLLRISYTSLILQVLIRKAKEDLVTSKRDSDLLSFMKGNFNPQSKKLLLYLNSCNWEGINFHESFPSNHKEIALKNILQNLKLLRPNDLDKPEILIKMAGKFFIAFTEFLNKNGISEILLNKLREHYQTTVSIESKHKPKNKLEDQKNEKSDDDENVKTIDDILKHLSQNSKKRRNRRK